MKRIIIIVLLCLIFLIFICCLIFKPIRIKDIYNKNILNTISTKLSSTNKYNKSETLTLEEYLYAEKTDSDILTLNQNKDVTFNGKVILTSSGVPLNKDTAYSYLELKILFVAEGLKPRKNCDPNDNYTNGIYGLGCYIDIPKNN